MPTWARHYLIIIAAAMTVMFTNLGGPRLWDRDEPRNAGCAAEMIERGDWVVPVFNNELRTHKPVLLYWLMMTSYATFGVNEFGARFWSAALGLGTVLLTYGIARKLFDARAGLWAALTLVPALMFGVASRAATPDAPLIFCSTLAIYLYVALSKFEHGGPATKLTWKHAVCVYAAMGLAMLAKGPVGLVLPTAVIGMYLLIVRLPSQPMIGEPTWLARFGLLARPFGPLHFLRTCWAMRPITAIGISLAVALPWYLWVHYRTGGAWTEGFFLEHNLSRATQAMEGHRGNLLFYPVALAIGFFPWSVFLAPMLIDTVSQLRSRTKHANGYIFAACWVGVYVVLFSFAKTKLPSYITPCYPGMAILMGAFVNRMARNEIQLSRAWLELGTAVTAIVGLALLCVLPVVASVFLPGEEWLAGIGLLPLVTGLLGWMWVQHQDYARLAKAYAISSVAFTMFLLALVPQRVDSHQENDKLLAAIYRRSANPQIGHLRHLEPTWVFYSKLPLATVTTQSDPVKLTAEKVQLEDRHWDRRPKELLREFLSQDTDHFVITTRRAWEEAQAEAPADVEIIASAPYFLRKHELIVVGRRRPAAISTAEHEVPASLQRYR